jgi:hypothetical protein
MSSTTAAACSRERRCYDTVQRAGLLPARRAHAALLDSARIYRMEPTYDQQTLTDAPST